MATIYMIENKVNQKIYIGSTINYNDRKKYHLLRLKYNKHHNTPLQNAYNKYGKENFEFKILEDNIENETIRDIEQQYLDIFQPFARIKNGYNIAINAEKTGLGMKHSEETKRKLSIIGKGRKHSAAHVKALADARRGTFLSKETHPNIRNVYQFTKDKKIIKEWDCSILHIAHETKIARSSLYACLNGTGYYKSAGGFIWSFNKNI